MQISAKNQIKGKVTSVIHGSSYSQVSVEQTDADGNLTGSYVHAAVLDSDGFEAFKEAGDVFDAELSSKLRKHIYEKGSTEEAMDLYVNFRGRKPIIAPLLKVRGLDGSSD